MVQPLSFLSSFALCTVACVALLPLLKKVKAKQSILHYVAEHSGKNGTPTMGGIAFIVAIIVTACIFCDLSNRGTVVALAVFAGYAVVGFLDDFIKVVKHRNLGLTAPQKIVLQVAVTVGFLVGLHALGLLSTQVMLPVFGTVELGVFFYPIAFFGTIFMVNAVNLTDGLDGLCTSVTFVSMLGYLLAGSLLGFVHVSVIASAAAGACAGFLLWNFYPAKVFMGDTGSMFFGGLVTALAFVMDRPELVLFFGIVYIWDAITVVIQRLYFKATHGKRIFRMTPIHHHFEMGGWSEVKIFSVFTGVTVLMCLLAWLGVMNRYPL